MIYDEVKMWEILDNEASAEDIEAHKYALQHDAAYRAAFEQLADMHTDLTQLQIENPSMRFTQNVMEAICPQIQVANPKRDFAPWVLLGFSILTLCLGIFLVSKAEIETPTTVLKMNTWFNFEVGSLLMLFNLALALLILDRRVLQPFFKKYV